MAGVAAAFATEQIVPVQFLCGESCLLREIVIEFRGEGTDAVGTLIGGNRVGELIKVLTGESAVCGAKLQRSRVSVEDSGTYRGTAYGLNVRRPVNFQRAYPVDLLKEELVVAPGELPHHASGIWIGHFVGIQRRAFCLISRSVLQLVSCRPAIPEVAAI